MNVALPLEQHEITDGPLCYCIINETKTGMVELAKLFEWLLTYQPPTEEEKLLTYWLPHHCVTKPA
jgi:hypothetical protein